MTIEEKIFRRMRFDKDRAEAYGFETTENGCELRRSFMDDDFEAVINVSRDGKLSGVVIDKMNDEEYVQLRNPNFNGAYVNTVRSAYEDLLRDIAAACFIDTNKKRGKMNEELIRRVLGIADSIPYGRVASYGQIASIAGIPKNARMVGKIMSMADRYGDHPCHRVVGHSGRTVPGWNEQRGLLEAEGIRFKDNGCVDMAAFRWRNINEQQ